MLEILARRDAGASPVSDSRRLLLEGSWPDGCDPQRHASLDDAIDGRFDWIDRLASSWAAEIAGDAPLGGSAERPSAAYLNALALRYYLVRPLRLVAYFTEVAPLRTGQRVRLAACRRRDADFIAILQQLCRLAGASLTLHGLDEAEPAAKDFPRNDSWRRLLSSATRLLDRPAAIESELPRVVLCGNPRLLDPVCRELVQRGTIAWWLYDRFAVNAWVQWRPRGVGQLVCDSSLGRENRLELPSIPSLVHRGVDVAPVAAAWLAERVATHGARQTRLVDQIEGHFRAVQPQAVVLDEDATPMARATVAAARRQGAATLVVQHGLPVCRFGFAPLAADGALVWGRSSQEVLSGWGVPPQRIQITGQPRLEQYRHWFGRSASRSPECRPRRVLLLTIRPPQADRPDAVALHLTPRTYAGMILAAFEAVAAQPGAELIVKVHPRAGVDRAVVEAAERFPQLPVEMVTSGPAEALFSRVRCAVSCGSTAGVEAALAGLPVVALAPPGASAFPTHEAWGLAGTARDASQLRSLIGGILDGEITGHVPGDAVLLDDGRTAAERIADVVLRSAEEQRELAGRMHAAIGSVVPQYS